MGVILSGIVRAMELIARGDPQLLQIVGLTLAISGTATIVAAAWSLPAATLLGLRKFRGSELLRNMFNALIGMPTVALGTVLYLLFCRGGPLGSIHLLYTPAAIVIGEAILITPIAVSFMVSAITSVDPRVGDLAKTLGASSSQAEWCVIREASSGILLAVVASFGRAAAELGVALMVGGNIPGSTRVLTTAIAIGINRGDLELAIALTIILLGIVAAVTMATNRLARRGVTG